jgi:hypothetical protein
MLNRPELSKIYTTSTELPPQTVATDAIVLTVSAYPNCVLVIVNETESVGSIVNIGICR